MDGTPCADDGVECTDDMCINEVCDHASRVSVFLGSTPGDQETLTRSQNNHILLSFDDDVSAPEAGDLEIRPILPGCTLGDDLSGSFSMTVEEDGEGQQRVVNIAEVGDVLIHREWYSISNVGGWDCVAPFEIQLLLQVGDANNDGTVTFADLARINGDCCGPAPKDARSDCNGDGAITFADMSTANSRIPSPTVPNPCDGP